MAKKKKTEETKAEFKDIQGLVDDLRGKFGEGSIMSLGEAKLVDVDVIPTGSFSLDLALGVGGLPQGRIVEIFGPESSGKSTLALNVVAQSQAKGGRAAYIDAEHALDPVYAARLGVKVKDLLISQPDNGEEALNILESLVRSGMIDLVVIDSVAALTPKSEIEGEMGQQFMGLQARMMSQALRKLTAIVARYNVSVVFINQIRMKIGIMFGSPETQPGGRALKFASSVRIDLRRTAQIKKGEDVVGSRVKAKIVKNKVAPPFRVAEFDIMYGTGINYEADIINSAMKHGTVTRSGSTYSFEGEKIAVGIDKTADKLREDKKLAKEISKKTIAAAKDAFTSSFNPTEEQDEKEAPEPTDD
ncbi:MAG: recombinase RecA [Candidatus Harrisonbacteria bacterium CG10_big_fil_rev_8_21_14_0_10_49_15]|uniref:Protein RecA n=1 Tax=Candidatus Harrisonbacteria bacterium CG10_big_fil_rev_8_21_14_0_10_49_15 TaxID=1974587 RepID=A0A2H0UM96_9BACT|nr:MAG: recombinase RecA [Candidatus Harrisonbacteria bacterium CG10_big_fil_rev_8_21_14_0_10_49_15]